MRTALAVQSSVAVCAVVRKQGQLQRYPEMKMLTLLKPLLKKETMKKMLIWGKMGTLLRKREAPTLVSSPATRP